MDNAGPLEVQHGRGSCRVHDKTASFGREEKMLETKYNPKNFRSFPFFEKKHPGFYMVFLEQRVEIISTVAKKRLSFHHFIERKTSLKSSSLADTCLCSVLQTKLEIILGILESII